MRHIAIAIYLIAAICSSGCTGVCTKRTMLRITIEPSKGMSGNDLKTSILPLDNRVAGVHSGVNASGQNYIEILLTPEGKKGLATLTTGKVGQILNIYFNEELICSATIVSPLTEGAVWISGSLSKEQAKSTVEQIRSRVARQGMHMQRLPDR